MDDRPDGSELLTVARRLLLDGLLPLLPAGKTYDVLMVANAMAIASRELRLLGRTRREADEQIERFFVSSGLGHFPQHAETPDAAGHKEALLAKQIRARSVPREHYRPLHQLLLSLTRAKLAITNPKHLGSQGALHE
ncbi:MAG TPA: DUF6285 domain-containing protein [Candidimonas sp.]|nr:DUF6285 domain-containing protein [Candidimonas sp.]